jgi:hypothetical protein
VSRCRCRYARRRCATSRERRAWPRLRAHAAVLLAVAAWVTFTLLAIGVWLLGRVGDLLRGAEAVCGGAPTKLVYVPSFMPRAAEEPMHLLGPGAHVNELADNTRESHYVDSN